MKELKKLALNKVDSTNDPSLASLNMLPLISQEDLGQLEQSYSDYIHYCESYLILSISGCKKKEESRLYVIFPAFRRLRRADSMYDYHYTLAFEPDFLLEPRSTLNYGRPS